MTPEQYRFTVALIIFSTPLIILTNFKFNSFGRYVTIVLLALYSVISISHAANMLKTGNYAKEIQISLAALVAVANFYAIYYFIGKPYRDRLEESNTSARQPGKSESPRRSSKKTPAARRRRSKNP
jgi:glucan phosphoethanolaminetransferase (alkaline phosphatase superfamily)